MNRLIALFSSICIFVSAEANALPPIKFPNSPIKSIEDILTPKKNLSRSTLAVNAFANDSRFGGIKAQYKEVKAVLKLKHVRVLFAWNDQIQPSPSSSQFFGFYDEIARSLPSGVDALVVLTGLPSWMKDSKNWINGNPRETFVKKWVEPVVDRYKRNSRIAGFQIWNEPNMLANPDNTTLDIADSPENYVELLAFADSYIKDKAPKKKVVNAATTAINQNYPDTLNYNKALVDSGMLLITDVFAFHYYGKSVEQMILGGGRDFIRNINKPIWVTESGEKGTLKQKEYAQRIFPFLLDLSSQVKRVYIYQFTEATPADSTYGLKNLTPGRVLSDLYIYLRDLI